MRAGAPGQLELGGEQAGAQLLQGLAPRHGGQKKSIRPQRPADLNERPGDVVQVLQSEQGDGEIEACRLKRQPSVLRNPARRVVEQPSVELDPDHRLDLARGGEGGGRGLGAAEQGGGGREAPLDGGEPLGQIGGGPHHQKIGAGDSPTLTLS